MLNKIQESMQRYMIHVQNSGGYSPKNAQALLHRARELLEYKGTIVRDTRVSGKHIEFDISIPDHNTLEQVLRSLEEISPTAGYEHVVERGMSKEEAITRAVHLFNEEKYWGAHESLESAWKASEGTERNLLNGIILVAAGLVHYQKDELEVCLSILDRAIKKFVGHSGIYYGIDIDRLVSRVQKMISSKQIQPFAI